MKKIFLINILNLLFVSSLFANDSVEEFKQDVCKIADEQLRLKFKSDNPYYSFYQELDQASENYIDEIKSEMDALLSEGSVPPEEYLKNLYRIVESFPENGKNDVQNLVGQYTEGININESVFDKIKPKSSSFVSSSSPGQHEISIDDNLVKISKWYKVRKVDGDNHAILEYKFEIVFDRATGNHQTNIVLGTLVPKSSIKRNGVMKGANHSNRVVNLLIYMGLGNRYSGEDAAFVKSHIKEYEKKLENFLIENHHSDCFAGLYKLPNENIVDGVLASTNTFEGLNRQQVIVQDQTILLEGKLSAHGGASTQDVN